MADSFLKRYYNDLARLFKAEPVVRHRIANKIASPGQTGVPIGTARAFLKSVNSSYARNIASYGQYNRLARYSDYNEMESMAEIGSALDLYAEETLAEDDEGNVLEINSPNIKIRDALRTLFLDVLNFNFNAFDWIRNTCKYGDQFLLVDHHPDYGVMNLFAMPVNEVEREEGYDPDDPTAYRYRWTTQGNRVLEKWQVIHLRLQGNDNFLPYGSSILEVARRVWRQLILMEDAVMVYRIVRSPERRVFYIDVGNISPKDIPQFMEKAQTQLKRNQIVDNSTGRVDLRYNPLSTDEDYFIPTRGEFSSRIETLQGGQYTGDIEDLQYIQNKLFAALKIPKSYLGYEQDISGKATLSQEDVRFAKTIKRIQNVIIAELNKIAVIHLYSMGYRGDDLVNFEITMANPSMIAELQKLELWRTRLEIAAMASTPDMPLDRHYVMKNMLRLTDEEIEGIEQGKRNDQLFAQELQGISAAPPGGGAGAAPAGAGALPPAAPAAPPTTLTSGKDPNKQDVAPNELIKLKKKRKKKSAFPGLKNHVFNIKKTAMDPKRSASELTRAVKAPWGEGMDIEERIFTKGVERAKRFEEELAQVSELNPKIAKILKS